MCEHNVPSIQGSPGGVHQSVSCSRTNAASVVFVVSVAFGARSDFSFDDKDINKDINPVTPFIADYLIKQMIVLSDSNQIKQHRNCFSNHIENELTILRKDVNCSFLSALG